MRNLARACALLCALELGVSLSAQAGKSTPADTAVAASAKIMADALKLREGITSAIVSGDIKSEAAIGQLQAANSPSGLKAEPDADFGYAAIDIGQRLVAAGKAAEAETFFQAAEQSLESLVQRKADAQAREKAQLLAKLSRIRSQYLKKAAQAKADIEQAIALQPEDKGLQQARANLARTNAQVFPANLNPKG